jgi:UDP-GlcNAc:undecaprenyl-phosphate GlcNAc-1-phosphate transferase
MLSLILLLAAAVALSILLLGILIRTPLARHFADMPGHRKVHHTVIPRLGGTGIVLTFLILLTIAQVFELWDPSAKFLLSIVFASLFLLISGTLDDVLTLGYKAKFLLQFLLAGVIVSVFGLSFENISLFGYEVPLYGMGMVLSIFWLVGLMNAVNIIDGIDGLAASVSLAGFVGVAALAFAAGAPNPVGVCVALSGATIGFLYYNLQRRRKVFLGDTGSQFLGVMLGILTLRIHSLPNVDHSVLIPLLLAGYPVLDLSVAMARRFLQVRNRDLGQRVTRMFHADNEHLHHRLVFAGLSHVQATGLLLLLASGFAATAVMLPHIVWQYEVAVVAYLAIAVVFLLNRLGVIQRSAVERTLRSWILGRSATENGRLALRYTRYYELFNVNELRTPAGTVSATGAPRASVIMDSSSEVFGTARSDSSTPPVLSGKF